MPLVAIACIKQGLGDWRGGDITPDGDGAIAGPTGRTVSSTGMVRMEGSAGVSNLRTTIRIGLLILDTGGLLVRDGTAPSGSELDVGVLLNGRLALDSGAIALRGGADVRNYALLDLDTALRLGVSSVRLTDGTRTSGRRRVVLDRAVHSVGAGTVAGIDALAGGSRQDNHRRRERRSRTPATRALDAGAIGGRGRVDAARCRGRRQQCQGRSCILGQARCSAVVPDRTRRE